MNLKMRDGGEPDVWTIKSVLSWSVEYLRKSGSESPRLDAEVLLADALNVARIELYLKHDLPMTVAERQNYKKRLVRRASHEPVAYITGRKEFFGLCFHTTPDTLIPRPDTETLIEKIISRKEFSHARILDLGTGSGCIAVSLAKYFPKAEVVGWDISAKAIEIAKSNSLELSTSVVFEVCDFSIKAAWEGQKFDLIVSNPPYISQAEKSLLSKSVRNYEPHTALFAGDNGLEFYKIIADNAKERLESQGRVFVEIGCGQEDEVRSIFENKGWKFIEETQDLGGIIRLLEFGLL